MNEKDLFKGIDLLKEECERSGNSLVVNVWHKKKRFRNDCPLWQ